MFKYLKGQSLVVILVSLAIAQGIAYASNSGQWGFAANMPLESTSASTPYWSTPYGGTPNWSTPYWSTPYLSTPAESTPAEIEYLLEYQAGDGGSLESSSTQEVLVGHDGPSVSAVPDPGYEFIGWSDLDISNPRIDRNVTKNIKVTALFRKIRYTITYSSGVGGSIEGSATQELEIGLRGTIVRALPARGYHFTRWSDGSRTATRSDVATSTLSLQAYFEVNAAPPASGGGGGAADLAAPVTAASLSSAAWTRDAVTVTLAATDDMAGVDATTYRIGSGGATAYTGPFTVSSEGTTTIFFSSVDKVGNAEATKTVDVLIDNTAPVAPETLAYTMVTTSSVTLEWTPANDPMSGVKAYEVHDGDSVTKTISGTSVTLAGLTPGSTHEFGVIAIDSLGNRSVATRFTLTLPQNASSSFISVDETASVVVSLTTDTHKVVPVAVTISGVTSPGNLVITQIAKPPAQVTGAFRVMDCYYDVSFSGTFTGIIMITLPYDPSIPEARARNLKVKHFTAMGWEDVTDHVDTAGHTITARLHSLSPIILAEPDSAVTTATITAPQTLVTGYRRHAVLTAHVKSTDASTSPLTGMTLLVQANTSAGWSTIATMSAQGASGTYGVALPIVVNPTRLRIILAENPLYTALPVAVAVKPTASLSVPKSSVTSPRANRSFRITGKLTPAHRGVVQVYCYKVTASGLKKVTTKTVTAASDGSYSASFKLARGTYRFVAQHGSKTVVNEHALTKSTSSAKVVVK